jgi:hypothetical protein
MARPANTAKRAKRVLAVLRTRGWLLQADPVTPSVAGLVADSPVRGSWWAHPDANRIYWVLEELEKSVDVLQVKLVKKKLTLVHRALWPALFAVAGAGEPWQTAGLTRSAQSLLERVRRGGSVRLDALEDWTAVAKPGEAARELESRLLTHSREIHTESGRHTKELESWPHLCARLGVEEKLPSAEDAKRELERVCEGERLPWTKSARRPPRARRSRRR